MSTLRAGLLEYLREEAANAAEICGDPYDSFAVRWKRSNLAAVALIVAVAGEPKPRPKKPRTKRRTR